MKFLQIMGSFVMLLVAVAAITTLIGLAVVPEFRAMFDSSVAALDNGATTVVGILDNLKLWHVLLLVPAIALLAMLLPINRQN
jgi:type II secretory pathway component PulF